MHVFLVTPKDRSIHSAAASANGARAKSNKEIQENIENIDFSPKMLHYGLNSTQNNALTGDISR